MWVIVRTASAFYRFLLKTDCGYLLEPPRRGVSNENTQSMFLSRNKKNNVYPCKHQFNYIKVGFKGVKIITVFFVMPAKTDQPASMQKLIRVGQIAFTVMSHSYMRTCICIQKLTND